MKLVKKIQQGKGKENRESGKASLMQVWLAISTA
jgi:hypothetical protein